MGDDPIGPTDMMKRLWKDIQQHAVVTGAIGHEDHPDCQCSACFAGVMRRMTGEVD